MGRKPAVRAFRASDIERLLQFGKLGSCELIALKKRFKELRYLAHAQRLTGRERLLAIYYHLVSDRVSLLATRLERQGVRLPEFEDLLQTAYTALIQAVNECYPSKRNQLAGRAVLYISRDIAKLLNQFDWLADEGSEAELGDDVEEIVFRRRLCEKLLSALDSRRRFVLFLITGSGASRADIASETGLTRGGVEYLHKTAMRAVRSIAARRRWK